MERKGLYLGLPTLSLYFAGRNFDLEIFLKLHYFGNFIC